MIKTAKTAVIFPGQGLQALGMGKHFSKEVWSYLFEATKKVLGEDLAEYLFYLMSAKSLEADGIAREKLQKEINKYSQLTTLIVSWGEWIVFCEKPSFQMPDFVAGHSLGEFTALTVAGVITFPEALEIVYARNSLMVIASNLFRGGMIAVISAKGEIKRNEIENCFSGTGVRVANFNHPQQVVVSGLKNELLQVDSLLRKNGYRTIWLPVIGPFHHPIYMRLAMIGLEYILNLSHIKIRKTQILIFSNASGCLFPNNTESIKSLMIQQVASPVRWEDIIWRLAQEKVAEIKEVGPGQVLTNMLKHFSR